MLFLRIISGNNNIIYLLYNIVSCTDNHYFKRLTPLNKYKNVLHKLCEYNHTLNIHNKWRSLQFVISDFNENELKEIRFQPLSKTHVPWRATQVDGNYTDTITHYHTLATHNNSTKSFSNQTFTFNHSPYGQKNVGHMFMHINWKYITLVLMNENDFK